MQRPLRRIKTPLGEQADHGEILHFSLQGLLSPGHTLALNTTLGTLSDIFVSHDQPQMIMQQQFSNSELSVLLPLLEAYPYFCPHDTLYASFTYGRVTQSTLERSQQYLHEVLREGMWDQEMRPMRNILSRARAKARAFSIGIAAILETGYILMFIEEHKRKELA